jgi:hypothetical protein
MIEISDNTATDYLIDLVGRDAVEAAVADLGHSDPAITLPAERFATPADVCRALVALDALADTPGLEPVAEVLSANPGTEVDQDQYREVFFKGGSEPGVLFGAWLGRRPDGSRVVVTGGDTDEATEVSPAAFLLLSLGLSLEEQ